RHTRFSRDWSSDVCSSDLTPQTAPHPSTGETPPPSLRRCPPALPRRHALSRSFPAIMVSTSPRPGGAPFRFGPGGQAPRSRRGGRQQFPVKVPASPGQTGEKRKTSGWDVGRCRPREREVGAGMWAGWPAERILYLFLGVVSLAVAAQ